MANVYQYYVEGQDEEKLINTLKTDMQMIIPGKVQNFNVTEEKITDLRLGLLKQNTIVILVYDTDTDNASKLKENIEIIKKCASVKAVWCIPQVRNLEQELLRSCDIKLIKELLGSKSDKDYKHDLIKEKRLSEKLKEHHFDIKKLWSATPSGAYREFGNDSQKVKKSCVYK